MRSPLSLAAKTLPNTSQVLCLAQSPTAPRLVSLTNEVVLQRLDGLCCVSSDALLAMVAEEDGLLRLGDGDALTTLKHCVRTSSLARMQ